MLNFIGGIMNQEKMWKISINGKYLVSDFGDIINIKTGYELQHKPSKTHGYHMVGKAISHTGTPHVHRIVYETFVGDIPKDMQINHLDGNKSNNHLSNLEVCTASENIKHAIETGLKIPLRGSQVKGSKVKEDDILAMYQMFKLGYSNTYVANIFGLHSRYVSLVRHGRRWKHLFDEQNMYETESLGLKYELPRSIYIYNRCMTSTTPQDALGRELGIDPTQVSRIRTGNAWVRFRKHFGLPEITYNWREIRDQLIVSEI